MNQRWRVIALWLLPIGLVLLIGWQVVSSGGLNGVGGSGPTVAPSGTLPVSRMTYGRFAVTTSRLGRVTAVDIYDGGRNAVVEAADPDLDNKVPAHARRPSRSGT